MATDRHSHEGDAAPYLLSALSELEEQAFETHLASCLECAEEVERLRPAAEALPRSVAPERPSAELKRSLMEVVEAEAEVEVEHKPVPKLARLRALMPSLTGRGPAVAWVSAAFLLAVGLAFGAVGASLLSHNDRTIAAKVDSVRVPEATGSFTISNDGGNGGILRVHGMPSLPSQSVYQVWVRRRGEVRSQSIFNVGENGDGAAAVTDDLDGADSVLVTREPAGGARAPSGRPVVRVAL